MSAWVVWRLVKWLGVLLFVAGVFGGVLPSSLEDRRRAVYAVATPGFVLTWLAGWALLRIGGTSMGSTWVSSSLLLSIVSLAAVVWGVETPTRPRRLVALVAMGSLAATVTLMTLRPGTRMLPAASAEVAP